MKNITSIILAAGKSNRILSQKSKIFHEIADLPIIDYVYSLAERISYKNVLFVCNKQNLKLISEVLLTYQDNFLPDQ